MSTSISSDRVEVTPELLDANASAAGVAIEAGVRVIGIRPETVLALVERIRELERERAATNVGEVIPCPTCAPSHNQGVLVRGKWSVCPQCNDTGLVRQP